MNSRTFLIGLLFVVGCQLATAPNPEKTDSTAIERPPAVDIWMALSHAVDANMLRTNSDLAQVVVVLVRNGDLNATDAATFDAAFPGIAKQARTLTADDATKLKSLATGTN